MLPRMTPPGPRLPDAVRACLFDLDGVLTKTAVIHAAAWKQSFDAFLAERARRTGQAFRAFDQQDYNDYVDGRTREDGVRSFLRSRGIETDDALVADLARRKNDLVLRLIRERGVEVYDDAVRFVRAAREAGLRRAVVSSSANCRDVLRAAGIAALFDEVVDGRDARELGLRGKPAPDTFLEGARRVGVGPDAAAVFEDAVAGVEAGRAGGFAAVVGVDRVGHADALREHGATIVVRELTELLDEAAA